jgi:UDP-2-acetamido-3-amino-2,3-dideoxy-glucuronate N-acetyltransferase
LGRYCFIVAGAVVTRNVPDYALMMEMPQIGWMSRHGRILKNPDSNGVMIYSESGFRYRLNAESVMKCLDLSEDDILPENMVDRQSIL